MMNGSGPFPMNIHEGDHTYWMSDEEMREESKGVQ